MKNIKLAYLVSQYPAVSHTFILSEVLELRKLGVDILVASINEENRSKEKTTEEELKEIEKTFYVKKQGVIGAFKAFFSVSPLRSLRGLAFCVKLASWNLKQQVTNFYYFAEALIVGKWMEKNGITHIHVHFANPAATVAMILCKIFPFTFSITVHGPNEFYDVKNEKLKEKFEEALFIRTIGHYARSQVMMLCDPSHWKKFEVAPLGIDLNKFVPKENSQKNNPFEILCVGRLTPTKGQQVLIASIDKLKREGKNVILRLIGDGPAMADLKQTVAAKNLKSSVIFEGAQNQIRVLEAYGCCDLFVLASFAEGIPIVLMEAMAMEIPCIATDINGIPELIRNDRDGILVLPSDDQALSVAIGQLMEDPERRKQLGSLGRLRVKDKYNLQKNIHHLEQIFEKYLA